MTAIATKLADSVSGRPLVRVAYERFLDCVHCGLCLSACPTYAIKGTEADSPRGRILLLRAVADGRIGFDETVKEHIDLCLGCLACETACPSGVQYHKIIEAGRELSRGLGRPGVQQRLMEQIVSHPDTLEHAVAPLRLADRLGLGKIVRRTAAHLPASVRTAMDLVPDLPDRRIRREIPPVVPAVGPVRKRVGFLTGCVMSVFFSPTHAATIRVLVHNGCEVHIPVGQGCCGALNVHTGDRAAGQEMARHLIDVFDSLDVDVIASNSAGCGSTLKDYSDLLADDRKYAPRASRFAAKVRDVSEILSDLPIIFPASARGEAQGAPGLKVAYHDACHLAHGQKVRRQPRALLEQMPGVQLVPLAESDWCCGSAGTYNLTQPEMADRLLQRKVANILETGADVLVAGNPGCCLQIARGLREAGSNMQVMHTMDLLATAYPATAPGLPDSLSGPDQAGGKV